MGRISRSDEARPARVPVASNRAPLVVKGFDHENFVGRWVNDIDDRIATFLAAGYEFVNNEAKKIVAGEPTVDSSTGLDSRVKKPVGRGVTAYLMRIPKKWWEEDQKAKQADIAETERAILSPGKGKAVSGEVDYGKVSISSRKGDEQVQFHQIDTPK